VGESLLLGRWESPNASRPRVLTRELDTLWSYEITDTLEGSTAVSALVRD
jgi:hypothetical protein